MHMITTLSTSVRRTVDSLLRPQPGDADLLELLKLIPPDRKDAPSTGLFLELAARQLFDLRRKRTPTAMDYQALAQTLSRLGI